MELVLTQNVAKLGQAYDVVKVRPGFARNFLLPEKKAVLPTLALLKKAEKVRGERRKKLEEMIANAKTIAEQLKGVTLTFTKKARGEKLYGSIGAKEIVEALAASQNMEFKKEMVHLKNPLKTLGDHKVEVRLAEGVKADIGVKVEEEKGD